ncbi:MAG: aspartyl protease family protein [Gemmataceae bacterium]
MGLVFPYRPGRSPRPVISLGGRTVRPRPLVDVTLLGPSGSKVVMALLDTGADDSVFPERVAMSIGIDPSTVPHHTMAGVGSPPQVIAYAPVTLRLTDGNEFREWPAIVGFTAARMTHPLLGFAGCLQFFDALFCGEREEVELAVNNLYPGI